MAFLSIDTASALVITFYFDFINNQYRRIASVGLVLGCVAIGMFLSFVTESPLWQLKMGKIEEAQITLRRMANINGVNCDEEIEKLGRNVALRNLEQTKSADGTDAE